MEVQAQFSSRMLRHMLSGGTNSSFPNGLFGHTNCMENPIQRHQFQSEIQNQPQTAGLSNQSPYMPQSTVCNRGQQVNRSAGLHGSESEVAWNILASNMKNREQDLLENSQISSIDFLQTQRPPQAPFPPSNGTVSTGLRLALEDVQVNASNNHALGKSKIFPLLNEELNTEFQKQETEFDQFLRTQGEQFQKALDEKTHKLQMNILTCVEQAVLKRLKDKDPEMENLKKTNSKLEERIKQLSLEVNVWQYRAKCSESMINSLKFNLQQAYAQNSKNKEGCGDSEVDDAASCFKGNTGDFQTLIRKENNDLKEKITCKVCKGNDISVLLIPCHHLCLCKDCESWLDFCPICRTMKNASMQVFMS